jgi:hypothetical protein
VRRSKGGKKSSVSSQGLAVSRDGRRFFIIHVIDQSETNVIHVMMRPGTELDALDDSAASRLNSKSID